MAEDCRKRALENIFRAFTVASEGGHVYVCDVKNDYSRWSLDAVHNFGMPGEYMKNAGGIWEEHIHPDDVENYRREVEDVLAGRTDQHDLQYRARTVDGEYVVCTCRGIIIRDPEGNPDYFCGVIRNHGEHSHIDPVTGLRNQYGFFEELELLNRVCEPFNILLIGISRFSEINNAYGYTVGNRVLQTLARILTAGVGDDGMVFRMDGARFAIITKKLSEEELSGRFRRRKTELMSGMTVDGRRHTIVLNGGMVRVDSFDVDDQAVYACLNYAYDESKDRQQGGMVIFNNAGNRKNLSSIEMVHVIRDCILDDCRGFFLCYQPVMDAASEKLSGAEALIRWQDERYGMVPPDSFIPVLEKDALFPKLGDWILRQAMTDGRKILDRYPDFELNINLSYAQMEKADFVNSVVTIIEETGFPAKNLCLEITERCRLLDMEMLKNIISQLRSLGVRFALDDFGTGYSSISILKELPLDVVKIDREFVRDIEEDVHSMATVGHISGLAGVYGSHVCAEGIETEGMAQHLKDFHVNSFQGYYYSKPIPFETFAEKYLS